MDAHRRMRDRWSLDFRVASLTWSPPSILDAPFLTSVRAAHRQRLGLVLEPRIREPELDRFVADLEDAETLAHHVPLPREDHVGTVVKDGNLALGRPDVANELVVDRRRLRLGGRRGRKIGNLLLLRGRLGLLLPQKLLLLPPLLFRPPLRLPDGGLLGGRQLRRR